MVEKTTKRGVGVRKPDKTYDGVERKHLNS